MKSTALTVDDYLASLPADRSAAISRVREIIRAQLDAGYEERMQYGMIGYAVPHRIYPAGYHSDPKQPLPFAALASQKNHMSLYLMGVYCGCVEGPGGETAEAKWFRAAWARTGKKLDMGKSCVRFKSVEDLALDVVAEAIRRLPAKTYIERYEAALAGSTRPGASKKSKKSPERLGLKETQRKSHRVPSREGAAICRDARLPPARSRGPQLRRGRR